MLEYYDCQDNFESSLGIKLFEQEIPVTQDAIDLSNYVDGFYVVRCFLVNQSFNGKIILTK